MDFICSGIITNVLPMQEGTSQKTGNHWVSQEFVIMYEGGQFPRSLCFRVFGQEKIQQMNIRPNEQLTVHLNITCQPARNGGYFNSIDCWKVDRQPAQQIQQNATQPQQFAPATYQNTYQQAPLQQGTLPFPSAQ